jgi:FkbH-like protein
MPEETMSQLDQPEANAISLCVVANFTAEPIEEFLRYWFAELQIPVIIRFAPYNQVFQQLLEGGLLRSNHGGINLVALDLDAWLVAGPVEQARIRLEHTLTEFVEVLRAAGAQGVGGAVLLFPPSRQPEPRQDHAALIAAACEAILSGCSSVTGWSALDLTAAAKLYSVAETHDPFTDELGNIPYTEEMYAVAAAAAARWIRSVRIKPRKVAVLDCDNTLWQGICGEGTAQVTEPYRRLQEFLLAQRDHGVLLALASKNNESDVMATLRSESCRLKPEDFTAWRINWQAKSDNLKALSDELGLALNSFLFLDDSLYECMEVRNSCPEVLAITLPPDPKAIPAFLEHLWAFDRPAATAEDRGRANMYQAERRRADLNRQALTPEEFLASLHIEVEIAAITEADLPRVAQLTQRTTQFNLTGVVRTVQSLATDLAQAGCECWTVRVRDIFGDYGLVGVMLLERASDRFRVGTFLLSCRALGRGVEDRMIQELMSRAVNHGANRLVIPVVPTERNRPAREFLNRLCQAPVDSMVPFECEISAKGGPSKWHPTDVSAPVAKAVSAAEVSNIAPNDEADTLTRIANTLQSAAALLTAVRKQAKHRPTDAGLYVAPQGALEESVARIWSECLAIESVGARDNYFDCGGTSLIATRILARVHSEFGVAMGLTILFEKPTVAELAGYISDVRSSAPAGRGIVDTSPKALVEPSQPL